MDIQLLSFGLIMLTYLVVVGRRSVSSPAEVEAARASWAALGLTGTLESDGPHMSGTHAGMQVFIEPRPDGRVEKAALAIRIEHPHLGGPFTLTLGEHHDAPRRPETGDPTFDPQAHLLTLKPLHAHAWLGEAQQAALLQLASIGQVRLVAGRLDILGTSLLAPSPPEALRRAQVALHAAKALCVPNPPDALEVLIERTRSGRLSERMAAAQLLHREVGVLPEVRAALTALLTSPTPTLRWAAVQALGTSADHDAFALDAAMPDALRLRAWLAGSQPAPPTDLDLRAVDRPELAAVLAEHPERAPQVLDLIEDLSLVESLPPSQARTAALDRLRSRRARRAGHLSLASTAEAGGLQVVDEVGGLTVVDRRE